MSDISLIFDKMNGALNVECRTFYILGVSDERDKIEVSCKTDHEHKGL